MLTIGWRKSQVERCLLATGVADAAFASKRSGEVVPTPQLSKLAYQVPKDQDERMWRPTAPRPTVRLS